MRRWLTFLVALITLLAIPGVAIAKVEFSANKQFYLVDGQPVEMDATPFVQDGRFFVPVRYLALSLGITEKGIQWVPDSQAVVLSNETAKVSLVLGSKTAFINGEPVTSDVAPQMVDGRIYLPARLIAEAFGYSIAWDSNTQTATMELARRRECELSAREIVKLIQPATVLIKTQRGLLGSGFFVSSNGEVVTNAHVVRGSGKITVTTNDNKKYSAKLSKIENAWDVAILKVDADTEFPYIEVSDKETLPGDEVMVFGNPLELTGTVTKGIISAKRTQIINPAWKPGIEVIQYDATTAPGSSGGPAVNMYGQLIGVHYAGNLVKDFNFAIPSGFYIYLAFREGEYNLSDDWYSFWAESWEWEQSLRNIRAAFTNTVNNTNLTIFLEGIGIPGITGIKNQASSYYTQYKEVEEVRRLFIDMLDSELKLYSALVLVGKNPYLYSQAALNSLGNEYVTAANKYEKARNALYEEFKR